MSETENTSRENEPRRHHYVPQCYLRGFAWRDGKLRIRQKTGGKIFTPTPANIMVESNLYNTEELRDGSPPNWIETSFHTTWEGIFSKIADETFSRGILPNLSQAKSLVCFAIHQHLRVPSMRAMMRIDPDGLESAHARQYAESFAAISTGTILKNFARLTKAVRMKLWITNGPQLFTSSDNPTSHWHSRDEWLYHVDSNEAKKPHAGTIFLFPISPRFLLEFTPGSRNGDTLESAEADNPMVSLINSYVETAADRFIILPEE